MVDVTPLIRKGQQVIQSYAGGRFRVSGTVFEEAILVFPDNTVPWQGVARPEDLQESDFDQLTPHAPALDVILLGCGDTIHFLPAPLKTALREKGLRIEVMDTGAACRTYNVLMAEGRRVLAALLPTGKDA